MGEGVRRRHASQLPTDGVAEEQASPGEKEPFFWEKPKSTVPPKNKRGSSYCYCCLFYLILFVVGSCYAMLAANDFSPTKASDQINFMMMRLFRDVSRAKARRRRYGQEGALMSVLLQREEPLPLGDASAGLALTLEELSEFDGRPLTDSSEGAHAPLLLAIHGRIYDVSAGSAFYGPGRSYHKLVGKDATRAFCTGCLEPACLISSTDGLSEAQVKESERWIELYEHHDKYKLVGQVREPITAAEDAADEEADQAEGSDAEKEGASDGAGGGVSAAAAESEAARAEYQRELVDAALEAERSKKHKPFRPR